MLRYEVTQIHLERSGRYYLPLPKLNALQVESLALDLERRGFSTSQKDLLKVSGQGVRFSVNPAGLASSSGDMLDSLVPSIGKLLEIPKQPSGITSANPYYALKRRGRRTSLQFFPRMEALTLWSAVRRQGECGLTPDEGAVLKTLLRDSEHEIGCVADYPSDGCTAIQIGRRQYFSSRLPASEFLANLRTTEKNLTRNCYLPRSSVLEVDSRDLAKRPAFELGEWCYLNLSSQNL